MIGEAVRLVFYTAARRREVLDARWTEVDLVERLWRLPGTRTKNRQPHVVPLSTGAVAVLTRLQEVSGDTEWVFPSPATASSAPCVHPSTRFVPRAFACGRTSTKRS